MTFSTLMNASASVTRPTVTSDSIGGESVVETVVISALPCRVQAKSGTERAMSGSTGVAVSHVMFCGVADIDEADTVTVSGVDYDVVFVNNVHGHHLEVDLWERRPGRG